MTRLRIHPWMGLLAAAILSCSDDSEKTPPPDPPGTISVNIEDGGRISFEIEQCGGNGSLQCSSQCIWSHVALFFYKSSLNFTLGSASDCSMEYTSFEIADVGAVAGLAEVVDKNPPGFTTTAAAQVGHGYVIHYTATPTAGGTSTTSYVRLYVTDWLTSALTGGVIGVQVKYQEF